MADAQTAPSNIQKLLSMVEKSNDILMTAQTIFPFTVFPDTVTIDRVKITIKRKMFFAVEKVTSIQIEDVLNTEANTGPFFGSLMIWTRFFESEPTRVNYLRNQDARDIKSILQGYIIVRQKGIDCAKVDRDQLVTMLYELGSETI